MSALPMASNIAHARRYGRACGLRQISEPNGTVVHSRPSSTSPQRRHHTVSPRRGDKLQDHPALGQVQSSLARQMHAKLNSYHNERNTHEAFAPMQHRSNSVDRIIRNMLPAAVAGINNVVMPPINIRNTIKNDLQMTGEKKNGLNLGSGANMGSYGLGLGQITSGFFRAQTDSIINALHSFTQNAGQISA